MIRKTKLALETLITSPTGSADAAPARSSRSVSSQESQASPVGQESFSRQASPLSQGSVSPDTSERTTVFFTNTLESLSPKSRRSNSARYTTSGRQLGRGAHGAVFEWELDKSSPHCSSAPPRLAGKTIREPKARAKELYNQHRMLAAGYSPMLNRVRGEAVVWPHVSGTTLDRVIAGLHAMPDPDQRQDCSKEVLTGILQAVAALHAKSIAHRDIKPGNIKVDDTGVVRIIDFGEIHFGDADEVGIPVGTQNYMAPELQRDKPWNARQSDLWSVGVVAFEILTGQRFPQSDVYERNELTQVDLDCKIDGYLSDDAADFVKKMLRSERSERSTMSDLQSHPFLSLPGDPTARDARKQRLVEIVAAQSHDSDVSDVSDVSDASAEVW